MQIVCVNSDVLLSVFKFSYTINNNVLSVFICSVLIQ